jgi:hypothetical protein
LSAAGRVEFVMGSDDGGPGDANGHRLVNFWVRLVASAGDGPQNRRGFSGDLTAWVGPPLGGGPHRTLRSVSGAVSLDDDWWPDRGFVAKALKNSAQ